MHVEGSTMRTFTDEISYGESPTTAPPTTHVKTPMRVLGMCLDTDVGSLIACPEDAVSVFCPMMRDDKETMCVMLLDTSRRVITAYVAAIGTATRVECDVSTVYRPAVALGATYILIAHNHPDGDPTPSQQDLITTKSLEACAAILGIGFVDHLVVATHNGRYRSIAEFNEKGF